MAELTNSDVLLSCLIRKCLKDSVSRELTQNANPNLVSSLTFINVGMQQFHDLIIARLDIGNVVRNDFLYTALILRLAARG